MEKGLTEKAVVCQSVFVKKKYFVHHGWTRYMKTSQHWVLLSYKKFIFNLTWAQLWDPWAVTPANLLGIWGT